MINCLIQVLLVNVPIAALLATVAAASPPNSFVFWVAIFYAAVVGLSGFLIILYEL